MRPIIGIVARCEENENGTSMLYVFESVRQSIINCGGEPLLLLPPQDLDYYKTRIKDYPEFTDDEEKRMLKWLDMCDGIILPGGYKLTNFDRYVVEYATKKDIPLLGICLGMQVLSCYKEEIDIVPIDENHPQQPINPYGQTKLMIEKIMDDYNKAYGLKSVRLRYFNVAGADEQARIGEWHEPETHLIPNILKSTFGDAKTFEMYGTDYDTKDGTCVRDYINVEDLAQAHVLALEYLKNGGKTNFFNLGTQEGNTVKEVFDLCEKVTEQKIPVAIMGRREGDPAKLVADNSKAKEILNWKPQKSLKDSIKSAYEWENSLTTECIYAKS